MSSSDCPFQFTLISTDNDESQNVALEKVINKKSAFACSQEYNITAPAECIIQCFDDEFFLGGFRMTSNAKMAEVYLTEKEKEKEYLTTTRGIPHKESGDENIYQFIFAMPGGGRVVRKLCLQLKSLKPANEAVFRITSFQLTARIPDMNKREAKLPPNSLDPQMLRQTLGNVTPSQSTLVHSQQFQQQPPQLSTIFHQSQQEQSTTATTTTTTQQLSPDDLGAAMAGVSFMVSSTEERLMKRVSSLQQEVRQLTSTISHQTVLLQQQQILLQVQQKEMESLRRGQAAILERLGARQNSQTVPEEIDNESNNGTVTTIPYHEESVEPSTDYNKDSATTDDGR